MNYFLFGANEEREKKIQRDDDHPQSFRRIPKSPRGWKDMKEVLNLAGKSPSLDGLECLVQSAQNLYHFEQFSPIDKPITWGFQGYSGSTVGFVKKKRVQTAVQSLSIHDRNKLLQVFNQ